MMASPKIALNLSLSPRNSSLLIWFGVRGLSDAYCKCDFLWLPANG
jgi:hypothetical protein